jgi:hypothetical protein
MTYALLSLALAQTAPQIPIQGSLVDGNGSPADGDLAISIALFDTPTGDAAHTEVATVRFDDGRFHAALTSVPTALLHGDLWISIALSGESASARVPIGWAPRAAWAEDAAAVGGLSPEALVTWDDVGAGLSADGGELSVDPTMFQARVGACEENELIAGIGEDGAPECVPMFLASDAVAAMGAKANGNPLNHDRYTDAEAVTAMGAKANGNPLNHDRYTDAEAVAAMGAKANGNPLNHDRYTDAEARATIASSGFYLRTDASGTVRTNGDTSLIVHANTNTPTAGSTRLEVLKGSPGSTAFRVDAEGDTFVASQLFVGTTNASGTDALRVLGTTNLEGNRT